MHGTTRKTNTVHISASLLGALAVFACGCSAATASSSHTTLGSRQGVAVAAARAPVTDAAASDEERAQIDPALLATLPTPPWSSDRLPSRAAPRPLLRVWRHADNRAWCAPLAPATLGAGGEGAHARAASFDGGWAVEFDKQGTPGIDARGNLCESCGRATFGIAGTGLTPEEVDDARPEPRWADGSRARVEVAEGSSGRVATLVVEGQGCVYQVWSFLGEEHLNELVTQLRFVDAR